MIIAAIGFLYFLITELKNIEMRLLMILILVWIIVIVAIIYHYYLIKEMQVLVYKNKLVSKSFQKQHPETKSDIISFTDINKIYYTRNFFIEMICVETKHGDYSIQSIYFKGLNSELRPLLGDKWKEN